MPADIDGDGKDDIVVFRPSQGNWYWIAKLGRTFRSGQLWPERDIPSAAILTATAKPTHRLSSVERRWYTLRSTDGGPGRRVRSKRDIPVAGDYDATAKPI